MSRFEVLQGRLRVAFLDLGVLKLALDADELLVLLATVRGPFYATAFEFGGEEGFVGFEGGDGGSEGLDAEEGGARGGSGFLEGGFEGRVGGLKCGV
jgi:hypothetical protein